MRLPKLSDAELKELLQQPLVAKLGTLNADGTIRITPLIFLERDGCILLNTYESNPHVQNLKRNPRCSLLIDTVQPPYKLAHFYGRAQVDSEASTAEEIAQISVRYGGGLERARRYAEGLVRIGKRVTIRFYPERVHTVDFAKMG